MGRKTVKILSRLFREQKAETDPPDGFNIVMAVHSPQFSPQIADMLFQRALRAIRGIQTDMLQQHGSGDNLSRMPEQEFQNRIFRAGKADGGICQGQFMRGGVQTQSAGLQHGSQLWILRPPQLHCDPGQQLRKLKRLGDIVRRAI